MQLRYKKYGKCIRCGECCIPEECEHFRRNETPTSCDIYNNADRPLKCKLFPEMPPIWFKGCGFYFVDTLNGNKKVEWRKMPGSK